MAEKIYAKARFAYNNKPLEWWKLNNPVLENGELGFVSDATNDEWLKIGDGKTSWNELEYKVMAHLADKPTIHSGTEVFIPDPTSAAGIVGQYNSVPYKEGDIYINTVEKRAYICTNVVVKEASGSVLAKYYVTTTWEGLTPSVAYEFDPKSYDLQTGRTVAEAINKIIGDIGDELTVAEMFFNINETLKNKDMIIVELEEFYFNIAKVLGFLGDGNSYFADSILYANAEGDSITAGDIKIGDLRNAINDIANLKTTTASKEYVDSLVGDINSVLKTLVDVEE